MNVFYTDNRLLIVIYDYWMGSESCLRKGYLKKLTNLDIVTLGNYFFREVCR